MFVGVSIPDLSFGDAQNAVSARMSCPTVDVHHRRPRILHDDEIIIHDQSSDTFYTPEDYPRLFDDADLSWVKPIADYCRQRPVRRPAPFPNVDVYAEGLRHRHPGWARTADLSVGQLVTGTTEFFTRDGDISQEVTNDAVNAWSAMSWGFNPPQSGRPTPDIHRRVCPSVPMRTCPRSGCR
jgi:hypothetical protein